jgi:hypothetical protein
MFVPLCREGAFDEQEKSRRPRQRNFHPSMLNRLVAQVEKMMVGQFEEASPSGAEQAAEKLNPPEIRLSSVTGHDFSRAASAPKSARASAPATCFFRTSLAMRGFSATCEAPRSWPD